MLDAASQQALLQEFFSENREALDRIERGLLQLESTPTNRELLNSVFRDMHTVKGNCRMMGFERLEGLTHAAESLLDLLREGKLVIDHRIGTRFLGVLDTTRRTLLMIEQTGSEGNDRFSDQILQLERFHGEVDLTPGETERRGLESPLDLESDHPVVRNETDASPRMESIRLSIERLDALMNQVGELGAVFNQLKYALSTNHSQIEPALENLEQQIHGLQGEVLQYRLQPIGRILETYHRLVRDLAVETKKKVVLDLVGEETEVDRNILISIKEVLGHLIRNAVDHGIESPGERGAGGKSPIGRIRLSAEQKQGQIYLEITDDGRGIDLAKVKAKALEKNLLTPEQAQELKEHEIIRLIMAPGFSTAEQVSKISGRGTGMDVVQAAIDKLGGTIAITSQPGAGSRFRLRIPQTMAIVPVLLVSSLAGNYAVPQVNIVELISYYGTEIARSVEGKMQSPMVRVRERLLPLVLLSNLVSLPPASGEVATSVAQIHAQPALHVVVLQSEEHQFALAVDDIKEPANLVIKPLNKIFADIPILAGNAVMPDGSVSFLLNVSELLKL
ncbi:MAG: chemotaxis protein CheA [Magnetococcales bacterium]|nr:chemotaxis protein CheA [Magnetococcales bacterium]